MEEQNKAFPIWKEIRMREARNSKVNSNSFRVISLLSKTWTSFWQRTGISGMTNAREAQSSLRKKIWIVLFTVFSILTISAMYHVLHDYSLHPVTTSITNKYQNQIQFPAVTICNQNRVNCEKLTAVKNACEEMIMNQTINQTNSSIDQNSASFTICNHMYDESQTLLQHLYDDGRCGTICRGAPKCFCTELFNHTSHSTSQEQNKEIVCEEDGGLVPGGECAEDEWCTGPYHRDFAECGKANLCEPKSCFNEEKDNGEEGFDCGGPCRRKCVVCATKESWSRRSNYDPGQPCDFPFKYKGIEYTECTDVDSGDNGNSYFWCATKVNEDREIAEGGRNWGECNDNCRRHGVCVPHSLAACEDAAKAFGKKVGGMNHEFASPEYKTKGCYGYIKGREWEGGEEWQNKYVDYIFYGTGGSKEQIQYGLSPPEYRPPGFDCIYDVVTSNQDNDQSPTAAADKGMCTGNFQENGKQPPVGTPCVGPCLVESGRWGSSYCYTDSNKNQWGAECISCQAIRPYGVCSGTYKEDDGNNGTLRAAPGTKCKSDCVIQDGRWGSSFCYTEADQSQWGAECVPCPCKEENKYTENTCKAAAAKLGMELGKGNVKFADFHRTKGCHAFKTGYYKGSVFYGLGGNDKEISEPFDRKASTYRPDGYDCSPNIVESEKGPKMCSGYFNGGANFPLAGSGCVYPCVYETGSWGSSWCYTTADRSEWGAECIPCSEMCTGSYTEGDRPLAAEGTKCEGPCIHKGGWWGASYCYTNLTDEENGWGAECVPCSGECLPYSGQACINAGEKLGLKAGTSSWPFAGDYGIKGCYAFAGGQYKGVYWYGIGTSAEIKGSLDHDDERYRPEGFDCPKEEKARQPPSVGKEMKFLKNFMTMNEEERKLIGHNFTSTFKACTFRGNDCLDEKNFLEFNVAQYGNCYSFNSLYNMKDDTLYQTKGKKHVETGQRRLSSLTGPSFGLNLIVALDQIDYMKGGITKQAGVSLTVHGIEEWPLINEYGMDISPSSYTKVAITETKLERQKYPHPSNCTQSWNTTGFNNVAKLSLDNDEVKLNYKLAQCQRFCLFEAIVKQCGCLHPLYTDFDHLRHHYIKDNKTIKLETCDLYVGEPDELCMGHILKDIDEGKRACSCGVNCEETQYEVKLSSSDWPSQDFVKEAKRRFGGQRAFFGGSGFKDNFAQIGVYFQSLNTKLIYEEPKYTLTTLTGAIGGSLSLYLGISVAMMFEVFEFIVDIFLALITFCVVKRGRVNPNS